MRASVRVGIEVEIERPPEVVWPFVSSERLAEWLDEFVSVLPESPGPPGVGSIRRYTVGGGRSSTFEIVEWDPPHRFGWDGPALPWRGGGARPRGSHTLTEVSPGRTRVESSYEPELSGTLVLLRPYVIRWLRKQRAADAQTLKRLAESAAG